MGSAHLDLLNYMNMARHRETDKRPSWFPRIHSLGDTSANVYLLCILSRSKIVE